VKNRNIIDQGESKTIILGHSRFRRILWISQRDFLKKNLARSRKKKLEESQN